MPSRIPGPAGQWDLSGHLRQFILLPRAGGSTLCHQGSQSLLFLMWLDSILKVLSNLNGSMISFWQPPGSHPGFDPMALRLLHTWAQVNHSLTHSRLPVPVLYSLPNPKPQHPGWAG